MDQSKSNKIQVPKRTFTLELLVGIFTIVALLCMAYLSINLGGLEVSGSGYYYVEAEFDNVSGLKYGASVEIAGVPIGEVSEIYLEDPIAIVKMRINDSVKLRDDDIASIRTKGIIGDRYVKVSRGASDIYIENGERMIETESVVDIEDIIGKVVHSLENKE